MKTPEISKELVEWLQTYHPNEVIRQHETYEAHLRRAGFQDCIDLLRHHADIQASTDLTDEEKDAILEDLNEEVPEPEGGMVVLGHRYTRPK